MARKKQALVHLSSLTESELTNADGGDLMGRVVSILEPADV
jgi:hypothetical protein